MCGKRKPRRLVSCSEGSAGSLFEDPMVAYLRHHLLEALASLDLWARICRPGDMDLLAGLPMIGITGPHRKCGRAQAAGNQGYWFRQG